MSWFLIRPIACGSFGEIWEVGLRGAAPQTAGPSRAFKISFRGHNDPSVLQELSVHYQFVRLRHEGLITLCNISDAAGRAVIGMELAQENLLQWGKGGRTLDSPDGIDELLGYIQDVAKALDYLREQNVVHGGMNPTDILLCAGRAKVGDFGPIHTQHPLNWSQSLVPFHKLACMSPEVRRGELSSTCDQYSLAATYAWLRQKHSIFPTMKAQQMELMITAPRERDVLLTALARDPQQRFSSCSDFSTALADAVKSCS